MLLHFLCICSSIYANFEYLLAYLFLFLEVLHSTRALLGSHLSHAEVRADSLLIPPERSWDYFCARYECTVSSQAFLLLVDNVLKIFLIPVRWEGARIGWELFLDKSLFFAC
jgi:hypothetical protein